MSVILSDPEPGEGESKDLRFNDARSNAKSFLDYLLNLAELQLDRSRTSKDRDHDLHRFAVFVDLVDDAVEVGKRPIGDAHRLVLLELDLEPRLFLRGLGAEKNRT